MWTIIIIVAIALGLVFRKEIVNVFSKAAEAVSSLEKREAEKLLFPDGYIAKEVKVKDYCNICGECGLTMDHYDDYYERYGAHRCTTGRRKIHFTNDASILVDNKAPHWKGWSSIRKRSKCSLVQKTTSEGVVVESYYLPSPPSALYFNEETRKVEC